MCGCLCTASGSRRLFLPLFRVIAEAESEPLSASYNSPLGDYPLIIDADETFEAPIVVL